MRTKTCLPFLLAFVFLGAASAQEWTPPDPALIARARKLLDAVPLVDGHNDVPWEFRQRVKNHLGQLDLRSDTGALEKPMHTDIARLRKKIGRASCRERV